MLWQKLTSWVIGVKAGIDQLWRHTDCFLYSRLLGSRLKVNIVRTLSLLSLLAAMTIFAPSGWGKDPDPFSNDFFDVLGLTREATDAEIKQRIKQLRIQYFVDHQPTDSARSMATRFIARFAEAEAAIGTPEKRQAYIRKLEREFAESQAKRTAQRAQPKKEVPVTVSIGCLGSACPSLSGTIEYTPHAKSTEGKVLITLEGETAKAIMPWAHNGTAKLEVPIDLTEFHRISKMAGAATSQVSICQGGVCRNQPVSGKFNLRVNLTDKGPTLEVRPGHSAAWVDTKMLRPAFRTEAKPIHEQRYVIERNGKAIPVTVVQVRDGEAFLASPYKASLATTQFLPIYKVAASEIGVVNEESFNKLLVNAESEKNFNTAFPEAQAVDKVPTHSKVAHTINPELKAGVLTTREGMNDPRRTAGQWLRSWAACAILGSL